MRETAGNPHGSNLYNVQIKTGNSKERILARLARDCPDILTAYERGEFKSARAAGIAAGFIKPPTPLETIYKLTDAENRRPGLAAMLIRHFV